MMTTAAAQAMIIMLVGPVPPVDLVGLFFASKPSYKQSYESQSNLPLCRRYPNGFIHRHSKYEQSYKTSLACKYSRGLPAGVKLDILNKSHLL